MLQTSSASSDPLFIPRKAWSCLPVAPFFELSYCLVTFPDYICSLQNLEGKIFQVLTPDQKVFSRQNKKKHLFISSNPREAESLTDERV